MTFGDRLSVTIREVIKLYAPTVTLKKVIGESSGISRQ